MKTCQHCERKIYCEGLCYAHYIEKHRATQDSRYHCNSIGQRLLPDIAIPGWGVKTT